MLFRSTYCNKYYDPSYGKNAISVKEIERKLFSGYGYFDRWRHDELKIEYNGRVYTIKKGKGVVLGMPDNPNKKDTRKGE